MTTDDVMRLLPIAGIYVAATGAAYLIGRVFFVSDRRAVRRLHGLSSDGGHGDGEQRTFQSLSSLLALNRNRVSDPITKARQVATCRGDSTFSLVSPGLHGLGWQVGLGALSLAGTAGLYALGALSPPRALGLSACGLVIAIAVPYLFIKRRSEQRCLRLRKSLPDFLDLMVACIEAGLSIHAALREVSTELSDAHPELTDELSVVLGELELGRTLDDGLHHLADRTQIEELRTLSAFVRHAQQFGSTMSDALRQLSDMLRSQRELKAEELAQKAGAKILVPTLLFIFPTIFVVLAGPAAIQIHKGLQATIPTNPVEPKR